MDAIKLDPDEQEARQSAVGETVERDASPFGDSDGRGRGEMWHDITETAVFVGTVILLIALVAIFGRL